MTIDKLTGKLARWVLILQEYEFKVIHRPSITHQNADTISRRPLIISEDFLEARQDFDQIIAVHVSYASNYLTLLQCNLVEHPIMNIWEDLDTLRFLQHGEYPPQVTVNHRSYITTVQTLVMEGQSPRSMFTTRRQTHEWPGFRRYIRSSDTLELSILIGFTLFITIGKVHMFKSKTSLLGVNNVIE